jgi:hypothetical protein
MESQLLRCRPERNDPVSQHRPLKAIVMEPRVCFGLVQVLATTLAEMCHGEQIRTPTYSALALLRQSLLASVLRLPPFIMRQSMIRCI